MEATLNFVEYVKLGTLELLWNCLVYATFNVYQRRRKTVVHRIVGKFGEENVW